MSITTQAIKSYGKLVRLKTEQHSGHPFILGYKNRYERVQQPDGTFKGRSRPVGQEWVGTLSESGQVIFGETFLKKHPEFRELKVYYFKNRLLTHSQFLKARRQDRQVIFED